MVVRLELSPFLSRDAIAEAEIPALTPVSLRMSRLNFDEMLAYFALNAT